MRKLIVPLFFALILIFFFSSSPLSEYAYLGEYRCYFVGEGEGLFSVEGKQICAGQTYVEGALAEAVIMEGGRAEAEETAAALKATVVKTQVLEDKTVLYCYTPKLKNVIFINGLLINLQIIYGGGEVIAATPLYPESF